MKAKKSRAGKSVKKAAPKKKVSFIGKGYHSVTPYLSIRGAAKAIEFYKKALGAKEVMRMPGPKGDIFHAEIQVGDSRVMLADEYPDIEFLSPKSRGGTTVTLHVYVKDVDATMERAVAAGAKITQSVKDQFYGDRTGTMEDPFGHRWNLATHKEDLSAAEMRKRAAQAAKLS
jgi:PhnB protein